MRLTRDQTLSILGIITRLTGENVTVSLFGSRLNDQARGGDVDLLIETESPLALLDRARIKMHLEKRLGLPVDIIARSQNDTPTPFQRIAKLQAIRLEATA